MTNCIDISKPKEKLKGLSVGIDFGTTNSLIAYSKDNDVKVIPVYEEDYYFPSAFAYDNNEMFFGKEAIEKKICIRSIKRLLGRNIKEIKNTAHKEIQSLNFQDDQSIITFELEGRIFKPVDIASGIIKSIKEKAEKYLQLNIDKAVITVPAYFDEVARKAVYDAASMAGITVLRLLSEPTSAIMDQQDSLCTNDEDSKVIYNNAKLYVVYDLGGGTFDVSVLNIHKDVIKVLGVGGDSQLGGDDFDKELYLILLKKFELKCLIIDSSTKQKIFNDAKSLKLKFNDVEQIQYEITIDNKNYTVNVLKEEFYTKISYLINKTCDILLNTLKNIDIELCDITNILLVGGASQLSYLREIVANKFTNILVIEEPEQSVVRGAAKYAEKLSSGYGQVLLDVNPLSIGIETMGGVIEKIIPCNSSLPISVTKTFTNYADSQKYMNISVWQGERDILDDAKDTKGVRFLGQFDFELPNMAAGKAKIDITFNIDQNGILSVVACDRITGHNKEVIIDSKQGLDKIIINNLLSESINNGLDDIGRKRVISKKQEITEMVYSLNDFLEKNRDCDFSETYIQSLQLAKTLLQRDNVNIEELNDIYSLLEEHLSSCFEDTIYKILDEKG